MYNSVVHVLGYVNNYSSDWTSLDPAIVSFRQFPQYQQQQPQQQQQQQTHQNQTNGDLIFSQINPQNMQAAQGEYFNLFYLGELCPTEK